MKKLFVIMALLGSVMMLQGCMATTAAKYSADKVCAATVVERMAMKTEMDVATAPNKIRVYCGVVKK